VYTFTSVQAGEKQLYTSTISNDV